MGRQRVVREQHAGLDHSRDRRRTAGVADTLNLHLLFRTTKAAGWGWDNAHLAVAQWQCSAVPAVFAAATHMREYHSYGRVPLRRCVGAVHNKCGCRAHLY